MQYCNDLAPLIRLIKYGLIPIFQLGIPLLLIVFGMIDLGKAVIASKEDEIKKAQGMLVKRAIYAVAVFFVVVIVTVVFSIVAGAGEQGEAQSWSACWNQF